VKIGIAGAGIMGRLLAWQLAEQGYHVSLFDQDPIEHGSAAAYTAAGMLTPYCELETAEHLVYDMGITALKMWPKLIEQWHQGCTQTKQRLGYKQRGSLVIAHPSDLADLKRFEQQLQHKLEPQFNQQTSDHSWHHNIHQNIHNNRHYNRKHDKQRQAFQLLDQQQLQQLEPELSSRFNRATYLPHEAWLNPQGVMQVLAEKLLAKGIAWHAHQMIDSVKQHQILTSNNHHTFDLAIDCRGLGAKLQMPELRAVRGELIWLEARHVCITRLVRLMHPRYRLYMVPQNNNRYVIGATQIESNDSGPITVRSALELLSAAFSIHDGFSEARILQTKTNCRPALKNNLPIIETSKGLLRINGLFRHGFLLAPVLANQVILFLKNNPPKTKVFLDDKKHKQMKNQTQISQLFNPITAMEIQ
jgi:glycine oxidase